MDVVMPVRSPRRALLLAAGLLAALLSLILVLPCAPVLAGEEAAEKEEAASDAKKEEAKGSKAEARVYTNKDLEKYRGRTGRTRVIVDTMALAQAPEPAPETLYPDEKERRLADLQAEISRAEARLAYLEQRARSVANPFLPRPQVPEEDREAEAGMDSRGIQERIRAEQGELGQRLAGLRADLARVTAIPTRPRPESAEAGVESPKPQP